GIQARRDKNAARRGGSRGSAIDRDVGLGRHVHDDRGRGGRLRGLGGGRRSGDHRSGGRRSDGGANTTKRADPTDRAHTETAVAAAAKATVTAAVAATVATAIAATIAATAAAVAAMTLAVAPTA